MKKFDLELSIGLFIIAGIICLGYLSIKLWRMEVFGSKGYEVYALHPLLLQAQMWAVSRALPLKSTKLELS